MVPTILELEFGLSITLYKTCSTVIVDASHRAGLDSERVTTLASKTWRYFCKVSYHQPKPFGALNLVIFSWVEKPVFFEQCRL